MPLLSITAQREAGFQNGPGGGCVHAQSNALPDKTVWEANSQVTEQCKAWTKGGRPSRPRGCGPSVTSTLRLGTFSPRYDRLTQPQKRRSPPKGLLGRPAPYLGFRRTWAWGWRRWKGCLEGGRGPKRFLSRLCCDILSITLFGLIVQRVLEIEWLPSVKRSRGMMLLKVAGMVAIAVWPGGAVRAAEYRSPLAVSQDGKTLCVSDKTAGCVAVLDAAAGKKIREVAIAGEPNGLALSADGKTLYVAQRKANSIALIDTAKGAVTSQIPVGTWPVALAVAENTKRLYCSNRGHHEGSPNGARPQAPAREPQGPRAARNRGPDRVRALAVMQGELGSSVRDCPRCFERLHVVFQPKWHSG